MLSTAAAAACLDISVSQFRGLTARLGIVHDDEYTNPHYKSGPPALLWSKRTLAAMNRRKAVKEFISGAAARSARAALGVQTKIEKLEAECEAWTPEIRVLPVEQAIEFAIESYNAFGNELAARGRCRDNATRGSDPAFLARIVRNYIRHELTDYEARLGRIRGRVGTQDAYEATLRPVIDEAVEVAYPDLDLHLAASGQQGEPPGEQDRHAPNASDCPCRSLVRPALNFRKMDVTRLLALRAGATSSNRSEGHRT